MIHQVSVFQHQHYTRCKLCRFWWVATAGASVDCTGTLAIGHECQAKPSLVASNSSTFPPRKWVKTHFHIHHISTTLQRNWHMGVSENRGVSPQIIHFNKVFHEINHPFWGFSPYVLETSISDPSSRSQGHVTELVTLELASSLCWRLLSWAKMLRAEVTKKGWMVRW